MRPSSFVAVSVRWEALLGGGLVSRVISGCAPWTNSHSKVSSPVGKPSTASCMVGQKTCTAMVWRRCNAWARHRMKLANVVKVGKMPSWPPPMYMALE